jgi:hypothetical protein
MGAVAIVVWIVCLVVVVIFACIVVDVVSVEGGCIIIVFSGGAFSACAVLEC